MRVDFTADGIHLPEIDLWLDPQVAVGRAWLSHAHSDHARERHGIVYGTPETLELYRKRWPITTSVAQQLNPRDYFEVWEVGSVRLQAIPAGHILGSAQLLIDTGSERIVYTGDIKKHAPICGLTTTIVGCDRLIVESTFGLPIYHFLSREEAALRIVDFAKRTQAQGAAPVFVGYPLGRGQEIAHVLGGHGIPTAIHSAIARFVPDYEGAGYEFGDWITYENKKPSDRALVVVPGVRKFLEAEGLDFRTAYVSGWASLSNARLRAEAQELIPYSDHGDFEELIALVEGSGCREVDVIHGYAEPFARILRQRGYEARAPYGEARRSEEGVDA
ncbi:MAG: MBL fold metallo-hydrolase [Bryobacter sp.]|nr:MBL fold metallo-hydrolase [Bryobacter sp.]